MKTNQSKYIQQTLLALTSVLTINAVGCGSADTSTDISSKTLADASVSVADLDQMKDPLSIALNLMSVTNTPTTDVTHIRLGFISKGFDVKASDLGDTSVNSNVAGYSATTTLLEKSNSVLHFQTTVTEKLDEVTILQYGSTKKPNQGQVERTIDVYFESSSNDGQNYKIKKVEEKLEGSVTDPDGKNYKINTTAELDYSLLPSDPTALNNLDAKISAYLASLSNLSEEQQKQATVDLLNSDEVSAMLHWIKASGAVEVSGQAMAYSKLLKAAIIAVIIGLSSDHS